MSELVAEARERVAALAAKTKERSRSRSGDEKKAMELARLLEFWMARGKSTRQQKLD